MTSPVRSYLVECFWPGVTRTHLNELDARAIRTLATDSGVRYLGSILTQEDEVVFCFFEGPSAGEVEEAARRAQIPLARVLESTELPTLASQGQRSA